MGDQILVFIEVKRNHRLNVKHLLNIVTSPETEVSVVLKRQADQIGHRVLSRFSQLFFRVFARLDYGVAVGRILGLQDRS